MDEKQTQGRKSFRYQRSTRSGIGIGTISLLVIFTVLCFSTLALLSVSTAASNQRIQQRSFDHTASLASAQGRSAESIAELDTELLKIAGSYTAEDAEGYMEAVQLGAKNLGWQVNEEENQVTWVEPLDRYNNLVTLLTLNPHGSAERYEVYSQKQEYVGKWEPEAGGQVMTQAP